MRKIIISLILLVGFAYANLNSYTKISKRELLKIELGILTAKFSYPLEDGGMVDYTFSIHGKKRIMCSTDKTLNLDNYQLFDYRRAEAIKRDINRLIAKYRWLKGYTFVLKYTNRTIVLDPIKLKKLIQFIKINDCDDDL